MVNIPGNLFITKAITIKQIKEMLKMNKSNVLFILGSGGHTAQMVNYQKILKNINIFMLFKTVIIFQNQK